LRKSFPIETIAYYSNTIGRTEGGEGGWARVFLEKEKDPTKREIPQPSGVFPSAFNLNVLPPKINKT
jgi:hypothetical protein